MSALIHLVKVFGLHWAIILLDMLFYVGISIDLDVK